MPASARSEAALLEEIQQLRARVASLEAERQVPSEIIEKAPVMISILRAPDFIYELANPAFQALAPGKQFVGRRFADVWAEVPDPLVEILQNVIATRRTFHVEDAPYTIQRGPGMPPELVYVTYSWIPLFGPDGKPNRILTLAHEVTGAVRERQQLAESREALRESEEQFRVLTENLQSAVALIDERGAFSIVNSSFRRIFDIPQDADILNINSRDWSQWQVFGEDGSLLDVDEHPVRRAALSSTPVKNQLVAVKSPSTPNLKWLLISAEPILDAQGKIHRLICTYYDITDRKRAEEARRESEERFRVAQELSPDGFLIFRPLRDDSGVVTDFLWIYENDAAARMNDTNPREVCGKRVSEVLPHHHESPFHKAYAEVAQTGEVRVLEEALYDQDTFRERRWFRVAAVPTTAGDVAILVQNVTERKRTEEALRESEERQRFLVRLGDALRPLSDPLQIQFEAARVLGEHLGAGRVGYAECEGDSGRVVIGQHYTNSLTSIEGNYSLEDFGSTILPDLQAGRVWESGDVAIDPKLSDVQKANFAALPLRALADFPLVKAGRLVAILFVHYGEAHVFNAAEISLMEAVAERTWEAVERARAEARVAADLAALTQMHALSAEILGKSGIQPLLQKVIDTAIGIVGAQRGTLQLLEGDSLRIVAHHGHRQPFLDFFAAAENRASVCGAALQRGERVVVPDVENSSLFAGTASLPVFREAGVRAVQSTPMVSRTGQLLGILTTQWAAPHNPDKHDLWRIDVLVRQAADLIEHAAAEETLRASEQRLRLATEAAKIGTFDWNIHTGVNTWSPELEAMYGLAPGDFGRTQPAWEQLLHSDDRAGAVAKVEETLATGVPVEHEWRVVWPDGSVHWIAGRFKGFKDADGRPLRLTGVNIDITERKRAEAALAESESRLRALLESASQGVVAVDERGRITLLNAKTEEMFGYTRGELLGQSLDILLPERLRDAHAEHVRHYFANPRTRPMGLGLALFGRRKDGAQFPLEISLSSIEEGGSRLAMALITDITERKKAEERLWQAQKLESIGLLAGGVAHDFNNLLVGVMGNASLAREILEPGHEAGELLDGVIKTGEQLAHLTRQMLAYSGKGRFVVEPLNLSDLLPEMCDLVRPSIPKKIAIHLDLEPHLPLVEADRGQLQQIFMNLVINAAEAIGSDAGLISVKTGTEQVHEAHVRQHADIADLHAGQYVTLEVRDTGCGMDEATKARIFDPFYSTKFMGRGLGLAAVAGIVRSHKGAIRVNSTPGKGSCFTVFFPVAQVQAAASKPRSRRAALQGTGTILVVDDEKTVRELTKKTLERYGYKVLLAYSGMAAIDMFKRHPGDISLVILDLSMPEMGGDEALPELRKLRPDVKVMVSSGYSESETMAFFRGQLVSGFVQKPYTTTVLAEKVKAMLS